MNFDQHFNSLEQFENFDQHFGRTLKGFVDGMTEAADVAATDMADRIGYAFFKLSREKRPGFYICLPIYKA